MFSFSTIPFENKFSYISGKSWLLTKKIHIEPPSREIMKKRDELMAELIVKMNCKYVQKKNIQREIICRSYFHRCNYGDCQEYILNDELMCKFCKKINKYQKAEKELKMCEKWYLNKQNIKTTKKKALIEDRDNINNLHPDFEKLFKTLYFNKNWSKMNIFESNCQVITKLIDFISVHKKIAQTEAIKFQERDGYIFGYCVIDGIQYDYDIIYFDCDLVLKTTIVQNCIKMFEKSLYNFELKEWFKLKKITFYLIQMIQ